MIGILISCKSCNSEEAKPLNPRYQVEPGNEILEPLALVENGARSEPLTSGVPQVKYERNTFYFNL